MATKDNDTCPRCGNKIVSRTGPYGKFYGCSSFPKCNYSRKEYSVKYNNELQKKFSTRVRPSSFPYSCSWDESLDWEQHF